MKKLLLVVLSVLICGSVAAQHKVSGKVTDKQGEPIVGAIVRVDGQENIGVVTDKDGVYSIKVPKNSTHLIFDYVNMTKTKVTIEGRSKIDVELRSAVDNPIIVKAFSIKKGTEDDQSKTLYLVDGKVVSAEEFKSISQDDIQNINVLKGISSAVVVNTKKGNGSFSELFGEDSADTLKNKKLVRTIVITSDGKTDKHEHMVEDYVGIPNVTNPIIVTGHKTSDKTIVNVSESEGKVVGVGQKYDANNGGQALVVVKDANGKTRKEEFLSKIDPNTINHITIIKNEKAREEFKKYGDTTNGVIYIELKDKSEETKK